MYKNDLDLCENRYMVGMEKERNWKGKEYFWWLDLFAGENLKMWEKQVYEWENEVKKVAAVGFFW